MAQVGASAALHNSALTQQRSYTGHPQLGPIVIGTDNSANLTLSLGTATPGKAKHALKRWATIRARVRQGIVTIAKVDAKVDTASMPVDFMTKWKGRKQTDMAVAYITNAKNQIVTSAEASALETPMAKTRYVVAGELDDVQLHREGDARAIGRPRKRIAVPGLRLVLHRDVLFSVALLEVLDEHS